MSSQHPHPPGSGVRNLQEIASSALVLAGAFISILLGPATARGGAIEDLESATGVQIERPSSQRDYEAEEERRQADAERRQAWAEYRAEQRAERAAAREKYNRELNRARQNAESSRQYAESSAADVRAKGRQLAQLRDAVADPATAAAADQRVRDARQQQAALAAQLADLQKWTDSLAARNAVDVGAAVQLSEDALYKVISPAQLVTPAMYERARAIRDSQLNELRELQEQSRQLSRIALQSGERARLEKQAQSRALFGVGSDLLDLLAPGVAKGSRSTKILYEKANLGTAVFYAATAPDSAERTKYANESVSNFVGYYNEALLDPALAKDPRMQAAVKGMGISLKIANAMIDREKAGRDPSGAVPAELSNDYLEGVKVVLDVGGVVFPQARAAHAVISLNERASQYARAQRAMAQIARMKGQGASAQEYIDDRILQVQRNLESTDRTIKAYEQGGRK